MKKTLLGFGLALTLVLPALPQDKEQDRVANVVPGFFQGIPLGDTSREGRHGNGETAFVGGLEEDFEEHAGPRLQGIHEGL